MQLCYVCNYMDDIIKRCVEQYGVEGSQEQRLTVMQGNTILMKYTCRSIIIRLSI